ncbi:hypothetical protein C095_11905 [Fusobacterium necrophorum subsp. funduliforme B35]|uniref:leucine--tRNA ligase n=1 Tax=Fusobacterium necrophorum subsp. funduliforme B35 TaxID=1226633 RepID=A0A0B4E3N0_9FUSO|nr:hypothetical protein C095_11905 [Fusobacterium necrophorum subsp. funduliforme B35]
MLVKVEKMSKSKNNGVDPEEMILKYGADTTRLFIMFAAPPEKELEWNENGLAGAYRFLTRVWRLVLENQTHISLEKIDYTAISKSDKALIIKLNQTIKKVTESIENDYHFNTSIAAIMELLNEIQAYKSDSTQYTRVLGEALKQIVIMLSPFVPHFCEELWESIGETGYVSDQEWPVYDEKYITTDDVVMAIQVNGKMRGSIEVERGTSKEEIETLALSVPNVMKHMEGKALIKVIVVPNKIVNIVVK